MCARVCTSTKAKRVHLLRKCNVLYVLQEFLSPAQSLRKIVCVSHGWCRQKKTFANGRGVRQNVLRALGAHVFPGRLFYPRPVYRYSIVHTHTQGVCSAFRQLQQYNVIRLLLRLIYTWIKINIETPFSPWLWRMFTQIKFFLFEIEKITFYRLENTIKTAILWARTFVKYLKWLSVVFFKILWTFHLYSFFHCWLRILTHKIRSDTNWKPIDEISAEQSHRKMRIVEKSEKS